MNQLPRTRFDRFTCPIQHAVLEIGDKWTLFLVREFVFGEPQQGFNQLLKSLKPISSRTLSLKLKKLVNSNIITKKILSAKPPKVEYSITKKGLALKKPLQDLAEWYIKHN